mmetsp:Transcript_9548/g.33839  ORF Transcript_9548/g.33839 Transcript_9548/m.33839 type:complete len:241 (+) Transcript_9548:2167-2889(+)
MLGKIQRRRSRQVDDTGFAGGVGWQSPCPEHACNGRDVHDCSRSGSISYRRQPVFKTVEDSVHVHFHGVVPIFQSAFPCVAAGFADDAGVVHHHSKATIFFDGFLDQVFDLVRLGDVDWDVETVLQSRCHLFPFFLHVGQIGDHNLRTECAEFFRDGFSDSSRCTCDDGHFSRQLNVRTGCHGSVCCRPCASDVSKIVSTPSPTRPFAWMDRSATTRNDALRQLSLAIHQLVPSGLHSIA